MLWTLFVILLVLWALGMITSYSMGGLIHILLVVAVVVLLITFSRSKNSLTTIPDTSAVGSVSVYPKSKSSREERGSK